MWIGNVDLRQYISSNPNMGTKRQYTKASFTKYFSYSFLTFSGDIEMEYWAKISWIDVLEVMFDFRMILNMKLRTLDQ